MQRRSCTVSLGKIQDSGAPTSSQKSKDHILLFNANCPWQGSRDEFLRKPKVREVNGSLRCTLGPERTVPSSQDMMVVDRETEGTYRRTNCVIIFKWLSSVIINWAWLSQHREIKRLSLVKGTWEMCSEHPMGCWKPRIAHHETKRDTDAHSDHFRSAQCLRCQPGQTAGERNKSIQTGERRSNACF